MPYLLSEWRGHIQHVIGEHLAAKTALDRLNAEVDVNANTVDYSVSAHLERARLIPEATCIT